MAGYHIGKLIEEERKRRGITQKELALGIFSHQMLYKLEKNKSESDKLQVDILLQRLGRSPDKLEIFMSTTEYQKIRARDLIEELILKKKVNKAEYFLSNYKEYYGEHNNVHMMFYNRSKAHLILQTSGNLDEALKYILEAIEQTLPEWNRKELKEYLISTYEMENLLLYNKIIYMMGKIEESQRLLDECVEYIENHYTDTEELAKIYPKCVWLLSKVYQGEEYDERITSICEKALDILRREAIGCFAIPVMEELISRYERMKKSDRVMYWRRFYNTFKSLYEEYAPEVCLDSLFSNVCQREYHLDYEAIKGQRVSQGYTQEDIINGVFTSSRPLSYIENNKKNVSKQHFKQLMNNMGLDKGKYNGLLVTDSFDVLQKKNVLDYFCCIGDYENAGNLLNEITKLLDDKEDDNRRFADIYGIIIDKERGFISNEESLKRCKELLIETYNIEAFKNRKPMRNEAIIINQIGACLGEKGRLDEKIRILEKVSHFYETCDVDIKYNVRSYLLLQVNYIRSVYEIGDKEKAILSAKQMLKIELEFGKTRTLPSNCMIVACGNMCNSELREKCKRLLKSTYYMYEYNYNMAGCKSIANYYSRIYDEIIK